MIPRFAISRAAPGNLNAFFYSLPFGKRNKEGLTYTKSKSSATIQAAVSASSSTIVPLIRMLTRGWVSWPLNLLQTDHLPRDHEDPSGLRKACPNHRMELCEFFYGTSAQPCLLRDFGHNWAGVSAYQRHSGEHRWSEKFIWRTI